MDVTDVLRGRMQEPSGLSQMAVVSIAAHVALGALFVFGPGHVFSHVVDEQKPVMTITIGGAGAGPKTQGFTPIGGRPVQTTEPAAKREAVRPPAAKVPEMTVPKPNARPVKAPAAAKPVAQPVAESHGRTPTRGDEVRPGTAVAETGARGQGFGLSTGGGTGSGSTLDVSDFCCPDYLVLMTDKIRNNWNQQVEVSGIVVVKFTIQRDGRLTDVAVERGSGYSTLDLNARRAVEVTRQLIPLPASFPNPSLTVHLNFQYQR